MKPWLRSFLCLLMLGGLSSASALQAQSVWINELHYDNTGGDVNEFVEIAGPAGTDLTGWDLVLYNGSGGSSYDTEALSGTLPDQQNGFGTLAFFISDIQNGAPDGLALVDASNAVVQFLCYEGTFTASGGAADGMTCTDIGVSETSSTPEGHSLQLQGTGTTYPDFTWAGPIAATPGAVNTGQTFPALPVTNVTQGTSYATIQAALDAANAGDVIEVANGTYNESLTITTPNLTLRGESQSGVMIIAQSTAYAITVEADGTVLERFTVDASAVGFYGIKAHGPGPLPGTEDRLDGLTLTDITVKGAHRSEFDLNGVDNATLTNLTANGQGTGGNAVAFTDVTNVTLDGLTTDGMNTWGGVAVYTYGRYFTGGTSNVTILNNAAAEPNPLYVQVGNYNDPPNPYPVTGLNAPDFGWIVTNPTFRAGGDAYTFYQRTVTDATAFAAALDTPENSLVQELATGEYYVGPGMSIQTALDAGPPAKMSSGTTVNVLPGTYNTNVALSTGDVLQSTGGAAVTTINGNLSGGLGTVLFLPGTSDARLTGFTVNGYDNTSPGLEVAAVYLQGNQANITIEDNVINAVGDAGLLTEYAATVEGLVIQRNTFGGQTFDGPTPGGDGFGSQFTTPNVPRSLVYISPATNKSAVTFSDNRVSGTAGGINASGNEQGNTLVTIDAAGATISGNTFDGVTTRGGSAALRIRGSMTSVSGNIFRGEVPIGLLLGGASGDGIVVEANTFDGNGRRPSAGISLFGSGLGSDGIVITGNLITDWEAGVYSAMTLTDLSGVSIYENCIIANDVGAAHVGSATLVMENNWWGSASGPGAGGANGISGNIDADPFATTPISGIDGCGSDTGTCSFSEITDERVEVRPGPDHGIATIENPDGITRIRLYGLINLSFVSITGNNGATFTPAGGDPLDFTVTGLPTQIEVTFEQVDVSNPAAAYNAETYSPCNGDTLVSNLDPPLTLGVEDETPTQFELAGNYPNPFNPQTTIRFAVPEAAHVTLTVYDVTGRLVTTLVQSELAAGRHEVTWDGRDASGRLQASGVYLYRLEAVGADGTPQTATRRMTLLK